MICDCAVIRLDALKAEGSALEQRRQSMAIKAVEQPGSTVKPWE